MVLYVLYAKADLEGVESLALMPGSNLCLSVRNPLAQTEVREKIVVDTSELHSAKVPAHEKHRDEAAASHFALKWDGHSTRSTIRILAEDSGKKTDSIGVRDIRSEDSGNFVPILKLECDGLEPFAFHPMGDEFAVTIKAGKLIEKVDLSSGDWSEYELSTGSASITNFETKFE